jgi:hypothetical protein
MIAEKRKHFFLLCCDCSVYWQPLLQASMDTWSRLQQEDGVSFGMGSSGSVWAGMPHLRLV